MNAPAKVTVMAGFKLPRRHVNPALRATVRACGKPGFVLAIRSGFAHHSKFSFLINAESVPASAINIERLERIADIVGFPKSRLFVDGDR